MLRALSGLLFPLLAAGSVAAPAYAGQDGDGVPDAIDNCIAVPNGPAQDNQADADGNGLGDACECGDASSDGQVDLVDGILMLRCGAGLETDPDVCTGLCELSGNATCDGEDADELQSYFAALQPRLHLHCAQRPGAAPVLSNLVAPTSLGFDETGAIQFEYADADGDIVELQRSWSSDLSARESLHAALPLGISGSAGLVTIPLRASQLDTGNNAFALSLVDASGRVSGTELFNVVLGGAAGGSPPELTAFSAFPFPVMRRPADVSYLDNGTGLRNRALGRFRLEFSDPDEDIERLRVRVRTPGGDDLTLEPSARAYGVFGASAVVDLDLLTFFSDSELGTYRVDLELIDATGAASAPASASIDLVEGAPGALPLAIDSFSPGGGPAGTEVTLATTCTDSSDPLATTVTLGGVPVPVTSALPLRVVVPETASTGKWVLRSECGIAVSAEAFEVPAQVRIHAPRTSVAVGSSVQLRGSVLSDVDHRLVWSVDDIPSGNSGVGGIDASGRYTPGEQVPPAGSVTISAHVTSNPALRAEQVLDVLPPPVGPGSGEILAASGGRVGAEAGPAAVVIPAGALAADTRISVEERFGPDAPTAEVGREVLGAVEFGPPGTVFSAPVTVTVPIARRLLPGSAVDLSFFDPRSGVFDRGEALVGTVLAGGEAASAEISHFSLVVADLTLSPVTAPAPTLDGVAPVLPVRAEEGLHVPVSFAGSNLGDALVLRVFRAGSANETADIVPGALHANEAGDRAAALLRILPIEDLPASSERVYDLRLVRPADGAFVQTSFTVDGLDELDLVDAQDYDLSVHADPGPGGGVARFSRMRTGEFARVFSANSALEVTGPVTIGGPISADGADGAQGDGSEPGLAPPGSPAGSGGQGEAPGRCAVGLAEVMLLDRNCDDDAAWGENAADCNGHTENPRHFLGCQHSYGNVIPMGQGGRPAMSFNFFEALLAIIADGYSCLVGGTSVPSCVQLGVGIYEFVDAATIDMEDFGARGFGAFAIPGAWNPGAGGGGGGGGVEGGEGWTDVDGGGGGAGGNGAGTFSVFTADRIGLGAPISADGGRGGNGGAVPIPPCPHRDDPVLGAAFCGEPEVLAGNPGGGGGGGAGGTLSFGAGRGFLGCEDVHAFGGAGGEGGFAIIDATNSNIRQLRFVGTLGTEGPNGRVSATGVASCRFGAQRWDPAIDPADLDDGVVDRQIHSVDVHGLQLDPFATRTEVAVEVRCEDRDPVEVRTFRTDLLSGTGSVTNVADLDLFLCLGRNTVFSGFTSPLDGTIFRPRELLYKHVVVVGDDGDGDRLSDVDEGIVGTDPGDPDTDGDGLEDGAEILAGADPLRPDSDGDGLRDGQEIALGTDPASPDSDGDGVSDGVEVVMGTDPLDSGSLPKRPPSDTIYVATGASGGTDLGVYDPALPGFGLLGQPNGGLGFGLAFGYFDEDGFFGAEPWVEVLYAATLDRLVRVDPLTGASSDIGPFMLGASTPVNVATLAFDPAIGVPFGVELGPSPDFAPTGQLLFIQPQNGSVVRSGAPLADPIHALAFNSEGRLFAALAQDGATDRLVELDPGLSSTGIIAEIGPIGATPIFGLSFARDDTLYGTHLVSATPGSLESELLQISVTPGGGSLGTSLATALDRTLVDISVRGCLPLLSACIADTGVDVGTTSPGFGGRAFVAVGNVVGDGSLDMIEAGGLEVHAYPGDGAGGFGTPVVETSTPIGPNLLETGMAVAVGNLDGDGFDDVVVVHDSGEFFTGTESENELAVALGGASGLTLRTSVLLPGSETHRTRSVVVADATGDGVVDVVIGGKPFDRATYPSRVWIAAGDGSGGFASVTSFATASHFAHLAVGEVSGDSTPDLVINYASTPPVLLAGLGGGSFAAPVALPAGANGEGSVAVRDVTGEGNPDVVLYGATWIGDGAGGFSAPILFSGLPIAYRDETFELVGDISGDGFDDGISKSSKAQFPFVTRRVNVYLGDGAGGFRGAVDAPIRPAHPGSVDEWTMDVAAGDLDGDGRDEVLVLDRSDAVRLLVGE